MRQRPSYDTFVPHWSDVMLRPTIIVAGAILVIGTWFFATM